MTIVFVLAGLAGVLALLIPALTVLHVPGFRVRIRGTSYVSAAAPPLVTAQPAAVEG